MSREIFINKNPKTLASGISSTGATSMTLSDVTGLPTSGNIRALVDSEIVVVTLNGTATITIARGQESTTAATHTSGATVNFIITAGGLKQWRSDNYLVGPYGSRPAAGNAGSIYQDNDSPTKGVDNGSSWDTYYRDQIVLPVVLGTFTGVGYSDPSVTIDPALYIENKGAFQYYYYIGSNAGTHQIGAYVVPRNTSSTVDWTATVGIQMNTPSTANVHAGICVYETSSGKFAAYGVRNEQTVYEQLVNYTNTISSGSASTTFVNGPIGNTVVNQNTMRYYQIRYRHAISTTSLSFYSSVDGIDYGFVGSETYSALNSMSTPDKVGFFVSVYSLNSTSDAKVGVNIFHWSYTEP